MHVLSVLHARFPHPSCTINVPFIELWPVPQGTEQKKSNSPALSATKVAVFTSPGVLSFKSTLKSRILRPCDTSMVSAVIVTVSPLLTSITDGSNSNFRALIWNVFTDCCAGGGDTVAGGVTGELGGGAVAAGDEDCGSSGIATTTLFCDEGGAGLSGATGTGFAAHATRNSTTTTRSTNAFFMNIHPMPCRAMAIIRLLILRLYRGGLACSNNNWRRIEGIVAAQRFALWTVLHAYT